MCIFEHVVDNIYLGDLQSTHKKELMKDIAITIDLSNLSSHKYHEFSNKRYNHLEMKDLTSFDITPIVQRFDQILEQCQPIDNISKA